MQPLAPASLAVVTGLSTPLLIAAGAAAGVPIAAHLLARRGGRRLVFPAAALVAEARAHAARRSRPRDALLLALRILAIVLIVLAFDRPAWRTHAAAETPGESEWVIVLDASASMQRTLRGRTLFDIARDTAADLLDRAEREGRDVAVVLAPAAGSTQPAALLPRPTRNITALRTELALQTPGFGFADLAAATRVALAMPAAADIAPRRTVIVVTDAQAPSLDPLLADPPAGVELVIQPVIDSRDPAADVHANLGVAELSISPARPIAERDDVFVSARIVNAGATARTTTVTVQLAGITRRATVTAPPRAAASATVALPAPPAGVHRLIAQLDDLAFPADNTRRAVVRTKRDHRVALVTAAPVDDPQRTPLYLAAAIESRLGEAPALFTPGDVSDATLASIDVVFVADTGRLAEPTLAALARFARAGGGVLFIAQNAVDAGNLQTLATLPDGRNAAPVVFADPASADGAAPDAPDPYAPLPPDDPAFIAAGIFDAASAAGPDAAPPALRAELASAWLQLPLRNPLPASAADGARTLLEAQTPVAMRTAVLTDLPVGSGRFAVLAADVTPAMSPLVKSPLWPALIASMIDALAPAAPAPPAAIVGTPIAAPLNASANAIAWPLTDDRGAPARAADTASVNAAAHEAVVLEPAAEPGFIAVLDANARPVALAAANLDPRESNTAPAPALAPTTEADSPADEPTANTGIAALTDRQDASFELWPALLLLALAALAIEQLIIGLGAQRSLRQRQRAHPWPASPEPTR